METMDQLNAIKTETNQDLCQLHRKVFRLFCLNCSVAICGACMDTGEHDLHQVSNLAVVYREKLSNVESKLLRAEKYNEELHSQTAVYEKNLQLLEEEESIVRKEIEAITQAAHRDVANMVDIRKETLREKLQLPAKSTASLTSLRRTVEQLSANEFVQQYAEIDDQCTELIGVPEATTTESVDDIECDLIPPYRFRRIVYPEFAHAAMDSSQVYTMKSTLDIEWKLTVSKSAMLKIKSNPSEPQLLTFRHILVVIIPHPNYAKQFRKTFDLNVCTNSFDVIEASHIEEQGFCNGSGDLVLKIGIRPLNAIIEKQLAVYQYEQQKVSYESLTLRMQSVTETVAQLVQSTDEKYDCNHLNMYFNPKLSEFQKGKYLYSYQLKDDDNRLWNMVVQLRSSDPVEVYAHMQLFKGSPVKCNYFVELRHTNPEKTIVKKGKGKQFDMSPAASSWGQKIITWDQLNRDCGFHPDGNVRFRFGVRPLPITNGGRLTSGAANA